MRLTGRGLVDPCTAGKIAAAHRCSAQPSRGPVASREEATTYALISRAPPSPTTALLIGRTRCIPDISSAQRARTTPGSEINSLDSLRSPRCRSPRKREPIETPDDVDVVVLEEHRLVRLQETPQHQSPSQPTASLETPQLLHHLWVRMTTSNSSALKGVDGTRFDNEPAL